MHMLPKGASAWKPTGDDFREINRITVKDNYPIPHIQDFT